MSSAVSDLQRAILGGQQSLTQLLRQTKVIAAKLNLEDIERWVDLELGGYPQGTEPPKYREFVTHGLEYRNPYQGWQFAGNFNISVMARQPIAEIENLSTGERIGFPVEKNLPIEDTLGSGMLSGFPQRFVVAGSQFKRIVAGVTDELLRWTTELDKRGIKGEGMNFNDNEKKSATNQVFNIGTVHGAVGNISKSPITINSQATLYDFSSIQQLLIDRKIPKLDRREMEDIMDELRDAPTEKKPSLVQRAEQWIVKHKDALGAGVEIVGKAIGAAMHSQSQP